MADVRMESLGTLARAPIKGVLIEIVMPHYGAKSKISNYVFRISFGVKSVELEPRMC